MAGSSLSPPGQGIPPTASMLFLRPRAHKHLAGSGPLVCAFSGICGDPPAPRSSPGAVTHTGARSQGPQVQAGRTWNCAHTMHTNLCTRS